LNWISTPGLKARHVTAQGNALGDRERNDFRPVGAGQDYAALVPASQALVISLNH